MTERGLPTSYELEIPPEGRSCRDIAKDLDLPLEIIEAAFINGRVRPLDTLCLPGDRLAFIPHGTPGPYRVLLGIRSVQG
jgi:hypothetical protein